LALFDLAAHEAIGCRLHDLEFGDGGLAQTVDLVEPFRRRPITSEKEPNVASKSFASGFTSRCGMARNKISSSIS
jgi:hypothetical protein